MDHVELSNTKIALCADAYRVSDATSATIASDKVAAPDLLALTGFDRANGRDNARLILPQAFKSAPETHIDKRRFIELRFERGLEYHLRDTHARLVSAASIIAQSGHLSGGIRAGICKAVKDMPQGRCCPDNVERLIRWNSHNAQIVRYPQGPEDLHTAPIR
jgi:hypothetical protein